MPAVRRQARKIERLLEQRALEPLGSVHVEILGAAHLELELSLGRFTELEEHVLFEALLVENEAPARRIDRDRELGSARRCRVLQHDGLCGGTEGHPEEARATESRCAHVTPRHGAESHRFTFSARGWCG